MIREKVRTPIINKKDLSTIPANSEVKRYKLSDDELVQYRGLPKDEYKSKPLNLTKIGGTKKVDKLDSVKIELKESKNHIKALLEEQKTMIKLLEQKDRELKIEKALNKELVARLNEVS